MIPPRRNKSVPPPRKKRPAAHIQTDLIAHDKPESCYTSKILAPIYEPKNRKPEVIELVDQSKAKRLIAQIAESSVSEAEKLFLIEAAKRHNVFNYRLIADYYAHSKPAMQRLMEASALVIVDFDSAIQNGYVKYSEEINSLYAKECE